MMVDARELEWQKISRETEARLNKLQRDRDSLKGYCDVLLKQLETVMRETGVTTGEPVEMADIVRSRLAEMEE